MKLKEKINNKEFKDQQNTSSSSYRIRSRNTFNKRQPTNISLLMQNDWKYVGFFILNYKTKNNVLVPLHEFTKKTR